MTKEKMSIEQAIRLLHPETTAEAIAEIKYYGGFYGKTACIDALYEASLVACEAMEKQIPKKPVFEPGSDEILQCQGCGADLAWTSSLKPKYRDDYCRWCGRAIDWSDYE